MTDDYHNWPVVKILYTVPDRYSHLREQRYEAALWLVDVEHRDDTDTGSYRYFNRYIKDPNTMLLFRMKFPDICYKLDEYEQNYRDHT